VKSFLEVFADVCMDVRAHSDELNELDGRAGDGDLGVTMGIAADAMLELLPELEGKPLSEVLRASGLAIAREAPSTAGTLVATGLLRAGAAASSGDADATGLLARLLKAAQQGIAERGKAELGSKTMLDALAPAAAAAETARGEDLRVSLALAAEAAEAGARATSAMEPRHGRAGWLAERSLGHEDAGARLVAVMVRAAARSLGQPQGV
jgi:dihydroxyacetone kinase-like protein